MEKNITQTLLERYANLQKLYEKLEAVSQEIYRTLESGSRVGELTPRLRENAEVAESISRESEAIVSLKKTLLEQNLLTERDRALLRESEQHLSQTVNRVIDEENKSRDIIVKQGVKISRK